MPHQRSARHPHEAVDGSCMAHFSTLLDGCQPAEPDAALEVYPREQAQPNLSCPPTHFGATGRRRLCSWIYPGALSTRSI